MSTDVKEYITVERGVATLHRGGERVGQWQAGWREYVAAGLAWPGCSCCDPECRHGLAHYWGEQPSSAGIDALIWAASRGPN